MGRPRLRESISMRMTLPVAAILAGAALTLGACDTRDDDMMAANTDIMTDPAATLPADNSIYTNDMMTNDMMTNDMMTNEMTP